MLIVLFVVIVAFMAGWYACRVACSPSCRGAAYLWTPELEAAAFGRGRRIGWAEERGELTEAQRDILAAYDARGTRSGPLTSASPPPVLRPDAVCALDEQIPTG